MSKTANVTATVIFNEEKLTTLNVYLSQQNLSLENMLNDVLNEALEKIFTKTVPPAVQTFISLKNGVDSTKEQKVKPPKKDNKEKSIGGQALELPQENEFAGTMIMQ